MLLKFVCETNCAEDGVEGLFYRLEITFVYSGETPRQIGVGTPTLAEVPIGSDIYAKLQPAHVIGKIIGTSLFFGVAEVDAVTGRCTLTQIAVVGMAVELV